MIFQRVKVKLAILSLLLLPVALVSCGEENTTTSKPTVTTTSTSSEDSNYSSVEESNSDVTTVEESNTETTVEKTSTETTTDGSNTETTTEGSNIVITYHVIFQNYDLTTLYETDVNQGEDVIYQGETPTKPENDEFTYEFKGWDKDLTNVQESFTTIAEFNTIAKEDWGPIHWF